MEKNYHSNPAATEPGPAADPRPQPDPPLARLEKRLL